MHDFEIVVRLGLLINFLSKIYFWVLPKNFFCHFVNFVEISSLFVKYLYFMKKQLLNFYILFFIKTNISIILKKLNMFYF